MTFRYTLALFLAYLLSSIGHAAPMLRTVALSATQAPGVLASAHFSSFLPPVLNNNGKVAFLASLSSGGNGIWSEGLGSLELVAKQGDVAPSPQPGAAFSGMFLPPNLSDGGRTAFHATLNVPTMPATQDGIWIHGTDGLQLVAHSGIQAPGTSSTTLFGDFRSGSPLPGLSDNGYVAVLGNLIGADVNASNQHGLWTRGSGATTQAFRTGMQAPGLPAGVTINRVAGGLSAAPTINDSGDFAFLATLAGPGVSAENEQSLWSSRGGTLHLVARAGEPAPGFLDGSTFETFDRVNPIALNNKGEAVFRGVARSPSGMAGIGVWVDRDGALHPVAYSGMRMPGDAESFSAASRPIINGASRTAFFALTSSKGQQEAGVWSEGLGALQVVARIGDQAPGTAPGVVFQDIEMAVSLNERGQLVFQGSLVGPDVTSDNKHGIWAQDIHGAVRLILRSGDALEVGPGDVRVVASATLLLNSGGEDGFASSFNDLGQVAFSAIFTDGSAGIFVSNLVAVPEPRVILLVTTSALAGAAARGRRHIAHHGRRTQRR
jgi:hypothetical protein